MVCGITVEQKHCLSSHLTRYPDSSSQFLFDFIFFGLMAPVQLLQKMSLYAQPVQALSDVPDQLCHAALLIQRLHDRVQLLEELWRTMSERHRK